RRLLSLLLFGRAGLRSGRAGRYLCARLSADRRSPALRHSSSAEEDPPHRHHRTLGRAMSEALKDLAAYAKEKLDAQIQDAMVAYGELTLFVEPGDIIEVLNFLKSDVQCQFISFIDISGVDYPAREKRFDVVYHLLSPRQNQRIRIKVATDEETP